MTILCLRYYEKPTLPIDMFGFNPRELTAPEARLDCKHHEVSKPRIKGCKKAPRLFWFKAAIPMTASRRLADLQERLGDGD